MTSALVHRGPDDEGFFVSPSVALGMRRLSVIDVAHGRQPMLSDDGSLVVVFNGEIYNYRVLRDELLKAGARFRTQSDTEVLLRVFEAHGLHGINRIEGMFVFAAWNRRTSELTLARDWLGQKSLFLARTPLGLAFASEIKSLLTIPGTRAELDIETLSHYMSLRYLPGEATLFKGITKLPASHALTIHNGSRTLHELWRPAYEPKHALNESELLDRLDATMREVVEQHLISEVPLGCFLSGGIDSSLVVAYAAQAMSEPVRTFSIGVHEASQNELPWAQRVATLYRTKHFETIVEPDLARLTPRMVATLEEPVDPFGAGVYVVSEVASRHVTVALGGDGGDELFAGYDRYKGQELAEIYARLPRTLRHYLFRPLLRRFPDSFEYNTLGAKLRWIDHVSDYGGSERYAQSAAFLRFSDNQKAALFTQQAWKQVSKLTSERLLEQYFNDGCAERFVDRMLHADCMTRLTENDLPTTDRMSMAHSLELRSPLLDRRIAEFAMRIPTHLKMKGRRTKYITRRLAARYLPNSLVYRPKKGFGFPLALWLQGPLRDMMQGIVNGSRLVEEGIFKRSSFQTLLDEHASGAVDHNYRLWMLFNLEIFWRTFIDGESVDDLETLVDAMRHPRTAIESAATALI